MADPTRRLAPALRTLLASARQESDRALLAWFVAGRDEPAFAELMRRHGPMVLGVSRRVTRDAHAAEDVFQATFLLLARKAAAIRGPDALGAWLHQAAFRLALRSRKASTAVVVPPARPDAPSALDTLTARELLGILDEELARLPEEYRAAVVLCGLEGLSLEEAARRLGWTTGSVKGRLERGRARLRQRLEERGLSLPGAMAAPLFDAGPCASLIQATRSLVFEGKAGASVLALVEGGVPATSLAKFALVGAVLLLTCMLGLGAALRVDPPADKPAPPPAAAIAEALPKGARLRLGEFERRAVGAKVAVTADGKSIVAVSEDTRHVTEWDFRTGKLRERRTLPIKQPGEVRELSPDGRWLVTNEASDTPGEQRAVVWDVRAGKVVRKLPFKGSHYIGQPAAFSPDGRLLAIPVFISEGKRSRQLRVWDWRSGEVLLVGETVGDDSCSQVAFSADGKQVLMALHADNYGIHCWDVPTRKKLWSNTPARTQKMLVMPQGKVLSVLERRRFVEHDLRTGAVTTTLRLPPCDPDDFLQLTPKGDRLLVSCREGVVVWDVERGRRVLTIPGPWVQVVPAPDGASVVTNIGTLQRWDLTTGKPVYPDEYRNGHVGEVRALAFSADGTRLISGAADGSIAVWDTTTGKPVHLWRHHEPRRRTLWRMHPHGGVKTLDVTPDGRRVFSAGEADAYRLWDVTADKEIGSFPQLETLNLNSETTHSLRLARDGRTALALLCPGSGGFGKEVTGRLVRWDFESGQVTTVCPVERLVYWTSGVDPEGRWFANLGRVFDARTGRELAKLDEYGTKAPVDAAFSPDGLLVAGGSSWRSDNNGLVREGPSIHVWEATTGKVVARLPGPGQTGEKAFHPSGRYLAYNQHRTIHLLDLRGEKEVKAWEMPEGMNLDGFSYARVSSFAFSPDGKTLVTGHHDGTIFLWDANLPAEKPAPIRPGELDALWKSLAGDDVKKAYHAAWRLAELPAEAVPFLRERLKPARAASAEVTRPLIADLDGDTQAKREGATNRLGELGHQAESALREALKAPASAEQNRRLQQLLAALEKQQSLSAEQRRDLRAVLVLGWVGTPEARKLLHALAEGNAFDPVTRQATASLARGR